MNKLIIAMSVALAALAAVPDAAPVAFTLFSDGTTNTWTQADLQAALQLTNRKYHRDMLKAQGRVDWHGPVVRRVVETNDLKLIEYHEDGFAWTNRWSPPRTVTPSDRSRNIQAARLARAKRLAEQTNGVPSIITETRQRGVESAVLVKTNIVIEANR